MKLNKVTITGADDSVKPSDLIAISKQYPFVEWGILFSTSRVGTPRYPSTEWAKNLYDQVRDEVKKGQIKLSAHFCGSYATSILSGTLGYTSRTGILMDIFDRYQVNFQASEYKSGLFEFYALIENNPKINLIIQANDANTIVVDGIIEKKYPNASFLFDASGGKGVMVNEYKKPFDGFYCGYAGGLNPDNLRAELPKIEYAADGNLFWIDTESGVRSDEGKQFDLAEVVAFLEIAKEFVTEEALVAPIIKLDQAIYTGAIAQCPFCKKPTKRTVGETTKTLMNYEAIYDEDGVNTNPDRNTTIFRYKCLECNQDYTVKGNEVEGFVYGK